MLRPDARFCDQCGASVAGEAEAKPPGREEAVRKDVTVLFCDVVGSTPFAERVDAEASREVMAEYHATAREVIELHGGTVAKFIGDGVMATYGLPEVAVDDAERAVRTGLELQERIAPLFTRVKSRHGVDLGLRVGINSGEVAVGAADDDLVGDVLNTAARLEAECEPGTVLVGGSTWRLTRSTVVYESAGAVELKGKAEPVSAHRVVEMGAVDQTTTPFVGRGEQLDELDAAIRDAVDRNEAVMVTVVGAPGVGKTRLAAEFVARHPGVRSFDLRCERTGATTFAPIADLVRSAARLNQQQSPDEIVAAIAGLLGQQSDERDRVARLVASFVGAAPAPSTEEAFFGVRRLCEALADDRPLVLVIDDIQWAEPLMLDLIEHLREWVAAPVLVVNLARPEIRETRSSLAESGRSVRTVVSLEGLDQDATRRLAAEILGTDIPAELADRLPASTEGNPLFVRELVRMLVDDGVITRGDRGWELTVDLDAIEVPPTIQSLLSSRVERMPDEERHFVELAAVAGSEFPLGAVLELSPRDRSELASTVERLRRKEVIEPTGTYRGDEPVLRFHHVLIRDAAYRRILKKRRAELHEQLGEWTERTATSLGGEHEAAIAHHFEQAHRYRTDLGLDDNGLGGRAAHLLHVAATAALARDDLSAAAGHVSRALAVVDESFEARAELLLLGCEAMLGAGEVGRVEPLLDELSRSDDERMQAWSTCFEGQRVGFTDPSGLSQAENDLATAADRLDAVGDHAGVAKARQVRAGVLARLGRVGECETELDRSLAAARAADDRRRVAAVLGAAPVAALWGPSPVAQAGGRCLDVIRLVRITDGSPAVEATSMRCQGVLEALRGRFDTARSLLADSKAACEELGLRHGLMETELYAGIVELLDGEAAAAEPLLRHANEGLERAGLAADLGQATAHLARAVLAQGRIDEAEELAVEAAALAGQNRQTAVLARCAQAEIAMERGRHGDAVAFAAEAVELLAGTDIVVDLANAHATLARALASTGDNAGARQAETEARRLHTSKGSTVAVVATLSAGDTESQNGPEREVSVRENAATRTVDAAFSAANRGDAEALSNSYGPGLEVEGHRPIVGNSLDTAETHGRADWVVGGGMTIDWEVLAVRDDRWCLCRVRATRPGGFEWPYLVVAEVDEHGHGSREAMFGADAVHDAQLTLHEWWMESLTEGEAQFVDLATRAGLAFEAGDADTWAELLDPGFESVDRRSIVSHGELDGDELADRIAAAEPGDRRGLITDVIRLSDEAGLALVSRFEDHATGPIERRTAQLFTSRAGRLTLAEWYDATDIDAAIARYDELVSESAPGVRRNAAWRVCDAAWDAIVRGDADATMSYNAPGMTFEDRRAVIGGEFDDVEQQRRTVDAMVDAALRIEVELLAVRDERWCLGQVRMTNPEGFDWSLLDLIELGDDGLIVRETVFDGHALAEADALLDEWSMASVSEAVRSTAELCDRFGSAFDRSDADALAETIALDFVMVDHRSLVSFGEADAGRALVIAGSIDAQVSLTIDVPRYSEAGMVVEVVRLPTDRRWQVDRRHVVLMLAVDHRISHVELWDADGLDEAVARFDELVGPAPAPSVRSNECWRVAEDAYLALGRGDVEAVMAMYAPDAELDDRRPLIGDGDGTDFGTRTASFDELVAIAPSIDAELVAVRDERWSLSRVCATSPDGFEWRWLDLTELDSEGLVTREAILSDDALVQAEVLLNEWWRESLPPARRQALELTIRARSALDARDTALLADLITGDFESVDHRSLVGSGASDASGLLHGLRTTYADGTVWSFAIDVPRLSDRGAVVVMLRIEEHPTGMVERQQVFVLAFEGDRIRRSELYDADDLDAALARHDELVADASGGGVRENSAWRAATATHQAINRGDVAGAAACYSPEIVFSEQRKMVRVEAAGRDHLIATIENMIEIGMTLEAELVAVRGDRWCLARMCGTSADGSDWYYIDVTEVGDDGLVTQLAVLDGDDLAGAEAVLNDWWLDSLDESRRAVADIGFRFRDAFDERAVAALPDLMTEDFQMVDHKALIGGGTQSEMEGLVTAFTSMSDGRQQSITTDIPRLSDRLFVSITTRFEEHASGSFERRHVSLVAVAGDRISRIEQWDADGLADALARFDDLDDTSGSPRRGQSAVYLENAATRAVQEHAAVVTRHDVDEILERYATDLEFIDLRPRAVVERTGFDGWRKIIEAVGPGVVYEREILAVRGDRLALADVDVHHPEDFVRSFVEVVELDADLRCRRLAMGTPDQLDDLFGLLDQWALAGEYAAFRETLELLLRARRAGDENDVEALRSLWSDDLVMIDHRSIVGRGEQSREFVLDHFDEIGTPTEVTRTLAVPRLSQRGAVAVTVSTDLESDVAIEQHQVWINLVEADRVSHLEVYDLADLDEACDRFDQLTDQRETSPTEDVSNLSSNEPRRTEPDDAGSAAVAQGSDPHGSGPGRTRRHRPGSGSGNS